MFSKKCFDIAWHIIYCAARFNNQGWHCDFCSFIITLQVFLRRRGGNHLGCSCQLITVFCAGCSCLSCWKKIKIKTGCLLHISQTIIVMLLLLTVILKKTFFIMYIRCWRARTEIFPSSLSNNLSEIFENLLTSNKNISMLGALMVRATKP